MTLQLLRGIFLLLCATVSAFYLLGYLERGGLDYTQFTLVLSVSMSLALVLIAADIFIKHKRLSSLSGLFLGLVGGLLAAYALSFVVDLFGVLSAPKVTAIAPSPMPGTTTFDLMPDIALKDKLQAQFDIWTGQVGQREAYLNLLEGVKVLLGLGCVFAATTVILQTKDDFRFVIPYVEFAREVRGTRPTLVDTSALIDGRLPDLLATGIYQGLLITPQFVVDELQRLADSGDRAKRARGRRGLDVLAKLQTSPSCDHTIDASQGRIGMPVDQNLIAMAGEMQGRIITTDFNLKKVAELQNIPTISLHDLAKVLQTPVMSGDHVDVTIARAGENPEQGVGYLPDGTMVVVEGGRAHIREEVTAVVTSTIQTQAGRMVFAKFEAVRTQA